MLRGKPRFDLTAAGGGAWLPPESSAYASEPTRPAGIRFYRAKESFFFPYSLLQAMQWRGERLTLTFLHDEVSLEGQGLHALYVELSEFKVARIREQNNREDAANEGAVHVSKIERLPRA